MKILKIITDLLGKGETQEKIIAKNTGWLIFGEILSYTIRFVWIVYVTRILGAYEYGKFAFAMGFVSLFVIFSDLGLSLIITREFSQNKEEEKHFSSILVLKIVLSILTLAIMTAGAFLITKDSFLRQMMFILGIVAILDYFPEIFYSFLRARQQMKYEFFGKIIRSLSLAVIGFVIIFKFPTVRGASFAYLIACALTLFIIWLFFHLKFHNIKLVWDSRKWKQILLLAWPLAMVGIFSTIYSQLDSSIMGYLDQIIQVGWYGAAYRIIGVLMIPINLIAFAFFPALSVSFKKSQEKLKRIYARFMQTMIFISFPLMTVGVALASKIIRWLYGEPFLPGVFAFQILLIMAAVSYLISPLIMMSTVINQHKKTFWFTMIGAVANLILNIIFIPKYSLNAASITTLISVLIVLVLFIIFGMKRKYFTVFNKEILFTLGYVVAASGITFLILKNHYIHNLHVLIGCLIGAIAYVLIFYILWKIFNPLLKKIN